MAGPWSSSPSSPWPTADHLTTSFGVGPSLLGGHAWECSGRSLSMGEVWSLIHLTFWHNNICGKSNVWQCVLVSKSFLLNKYVKWEYRFWISDDTWVAQVAETGAEVLRTPPSALVEHKHPLCALTEDEAGVFWLLVLKGLTCSLQKANRQRRRRRHPRCPSGWML